jgi:hypothetical protein
VGHFRDSEQRYNEKEIMLGTFCGINKIEGYRKDRSNLNVVQEISEDCFLFVSSSREKLYHTCSLRRLPSKLPPIINDRGTYDLHSSNASKWAPGSLLMPWINCLMAGYCGFDKTLALALSSIEMVRTLSLLLHRLYPVYLA